MSTSGLIAEESVTAADRERLSQFRCRGCGECCHLRIPVTDLDVRRIRDATGRTAEELVEFVPPAEFRGDNAHLDWIWFGPRRNSRRVMCLKEVDGHCMYLDENNRCGGYEYRPTVCRIHPFILEMCERDEQVEGVEFNDGCECAGTCDGQNSLEDIISVHQASNSEDVNYRSLVARWNRNRRARTEAEFLAFLGLGA